MKKAILIICSLLSMITILPCEAKHKLKYNKKTHTLKYEGYTYKFVLVEGGTFRMGATEEQGTDVWGDEKPVHTVTLSDYYIGATEVPMWLWDVVMLGNIVPLKEYDVCAKATISWNDSQVFIHKLDSIIGENFSLPTEAQWEYAARGGAKSKGYKYSGSNNVEDVSELERTHITGYLMLDVAEKKANELGIYDMSGNLWEFCSDWYGEYTEGHQTNPTGPESGKYKIVRGGSICQHINTRRVSCRFDVVPESVSLDHGLRLALNP